jgi:hypothetical protein
MQWNAGSSSLLSKLATRHPYSHMMLTMAWFVHHLQCSVFFWTHFTCFLHWRNGSDALKMFEWVLVHIINSDWLVPIRTKSHQLPFQECSPSMSYTNSLIMSATNLKHILTCPPIQTISQHIHLLKPAEPSPPQSSYLAALANFIFSSNSTA